MNRLHSEVSFIQDELSVVLVVYLIAWWAVKIFELYFQCIQNTSVTRDTRLIFESHLASC